MSQPFAAASQQFSKDKAGFPICRCPAAQISLKEWCDLMKHKPPPDVMKELEARGMSLHHIENAKGGGVNLDYYPVSIEQMPIVNGQRMTPDQLLNYMRNNTDTFFDPSITDFNPYASDGSDARRWQGQNPLGSVFNINMGAGGINVDDGSVVASQVTNRNWIFSTVETPWGDWSHPVSGNREFGYTDFGNGQTVFYTRGADRLTGYMDTFMNWSSAQVMEPGRAVLDMMSRARYGPFGALSPPAQISGEKGLAFTGADNAWQGFQQRLAGFVNANGGKATIQPRVSARHNYEEMKKLCAGG